jgi:hypothetical protein
MQVLDFVHHGVAAHASVVDLGFQLLTAFASTVYLVYF